MIYGTFWFLRTIIGLEINGPVYSKNRTVGAAWRYTLGLLSVSFYTILPGRFFGGDAYNPYTNTIYLYSDDPSIALHEAAHAKDFGSRKYKGTHAALGILPFASLYYEVKATNNVLSYLRKNKDINGEKDARKLLYPAYCTYIFGGMGQFYPSPYWLLGIIPGHIAGQAAAAFVEEPQIIESNEF